MGLPSGEVSTIGSTFPASGSPVGHRGGGRSSRFMAALRTPVEAVKALVARHLPGSVTFRGTWNEKFKRLLIFCFDHGKQAGEAAAR